MVVMAPAGPVFAGEIERWFGTAPFCDAHKSDCTKRGMDYVRSSSHGDGKNCSTGKKVLCRAKASFPKGGTWVGTAPACAADKSDCADLGMIFMKSDKYGFGKKCTTGKKVLCRPATLADGAVYFWRGTAPACAAQPRDCSADKLLYVKKDNKGDGKACNTGYKVQCVTPTVDGNTLSNWMRLAGNHIANKYLHQILLPGTHDSGTAGMDLKSKIGADKADDDVLYIVPDKVLKNWAKTQKYGLAGQLARGARYLDLRTCRKDGKYHFCHTLNGDRFEPAMKAIAAFAKTHPKEIIILDFQHFYGFERNSQYQHVVDTIEQTLGPRLMAANASGCPIPKVQDFWTKNKNVLVLFANEKNKGVTKAWRWDNKCLKDYYKAGGWQDASKLRSDQEAKLQARDLTKFWKVQAVLTVDGDMLAEGLLPGKPKRLMDVGSILNGKVHGWLDDWRRKYGSKLNIVMIDNYGTTRLHEKLVLAAMGK